MARWLLCWAVVALAAGAAPVFAEDLVWNGEVTAHGALRAMFHEGRVGSAVELSTVLPNADLYAVGALADLAGEVTVVGGRAYLTYPDGPDGARVDVSPRPEAGAALFVGATVPAWKSVVTKRPIPFEEIDYAIGRLAADAGMSLDERFPFLVEGEFADLRWHVIDGRRLSGGGSSHRDHLAAATTLALDRTRAVLIGFYSESDQGVFTHMGSRTHVHCVVDDPLSAGHVDHVVIPAGSTIKFPRTK